MELKDKVVTITGGSKGLGKALAKFFAQESAKVIVSSNDQVELKDAAEELGVDYFKLDVRNPQEMTDFAKYVFQKHGRIDIWVNNAGIQIAPSLAEDINIEKIHNLFEINFFGYFYGFKESLQIMKKQGFGTILSINSKAGLDGYPELGAYSASKFAVTGLTKTIRKEIANTNIKVYSVHPGGIKTELYKEKYPDEFESYMSPEYAAEKIISNLKLESPEADLVVLRPIV